MIDQATKNDMLEREMESLESSLGNIEINVWFLFHVQKIRVGGEYYLIQSKHLTQKTASKSENVVIFSCFCLSKDRFNVKGRVNK